MSFIDIQKIIFDTSLLIAIIAINMIYDDDHELGLTGDGSNSAF
ncbi:MAG: hypothetical protein ACQEU4_20625 [Bacillota bacterium]